MTCMCILLKPGMANLPVASIDLTNGSPDTSEVGVMLTIRPLSIRMLIPGVSLPSCVSTMVTPSNRSLPETACSTFGRACLWHPESKTAEQANSIVTPSEDRDMICYFHRSVGSFLRVGGGVIFDTFHNQLGVVSRVNLFWVVDY